MINEVELGEKAICTLGTNYDPSQAKRRNLGGAIFLAAIADYRGTDEQEYGARNDFYPQTRKWRDHYDWAVELAEGVNPAWLREALDKFRGKWDGQRAQRIEREIRRALRADRRNGPNDKQRGVRIHPDGPLAPTYEVLTLVFNRRARRAVHGLVVLRRAYEHVLVMATLEGAAGAEANLHYEDYVDALNILGARAA